MGQGLVGLFQMVQWLKYAQKLVPKIKDNYNLKDHFVLYRTSTLSYFHGIRPNFMQLLYGTANLSNVVDTLGGLMRKEWTDQRGPAIDDAYVTSW